MSTEIAEKKQETGLSLPVAVAELKQLGTFVEDTRGRIAVAESDIEKTFMRAAFIAELERRLDGPLLDMLHSVQGNPNFYKADAAYPKHVVRQVAASAWLCGLRMSGNEINIISGQLYGTKEGYQRLLREFDGFSNFRWQIANSEIVYDGTTGKGVKKGAAYISATASWTLHGVRESVAYVKDDGGDYRIKIKTYETDTEDLLRGKAESKLFRRVYAMISGDIVPAEVDDDSDVLTLDAERPAIAEPAPETEVEPPQVEPAEDRETPAQFLDRVEEFLDARLRDATLKKQVRDAEGAAKNRLAMSMDRIDQETFAAAHEMIGRLCEAKLMDIEASRGERSNG